MSHAIASPAVFEILDPKHIGVTTLTFWDHVTSLPPDHSIPHRLFPICFFRLFR